MNFSNWIAVYAVLLAESFVCALILGAILLRVAPTLNFLAYPGGRHIHSAPTPTLGGMSFVLSFFIVILGNLTLAHFFRDTISQSIPQVGTYLANIPSTFLRLGAVLGGALAMSVLGLFDDRYSLGPKLKLLFMILAALPLPFLGVRVQGFLPWPWMGVIATILWILFLTNSFNFLDNMDGLCGGIAAIVTLAFGLISFFAGEWFMTAIYAVLLGGLLGFLCYNFNPLYPRARMFMGDNGSLFIGYLIASLSILATYYHKGVPTALPVLTPVIVLGVPLFDTVSVLWIRWRHHKPLMQGDKNHFSHRLVDLGMTPRRAVVLIHIITATVALGALPLRSVERSGAIAILLQTALIFWIIYLLERTAAKRNR